MADHFGIPIVTFVDTPGAFAGKLAEELGQVSPAPLLHLLHVNTCFCAYVFMLD